MGYVLRVRFASFFTGAAVASAAGIYFLHKDYKIAHEAIKDQIDGLHKTLDERVSSLETFKDAEAPKHIEAAE